MRRIAFAAAFVFLATPLLALNENAVSGRIGVLNGGREHRAMSRSDRAAADLLPRYLSDELRRSGFDAHLVNATVDELQSGRTPSRDDYYLETVVDDGYGVNAGGIGVGTGSVGAEVSVVAAHMRVELRLYDARTFEVVRTLNVSGDAVAPAITGVGIGDWRSYLFLSLPVFRQAPYRLAAHAIARDAAAKIKDAQ